MSTRLVGLAVAFALFAAGLAGCGLGAGERSSEARVLVTRDFGAEQLGGRIVQNLSGSETALQLLRRSVDVGAHDGGGADWFVYVNGIGQERDAADVGLHGGDRIWWDRHAGGAAADVPAVVGAYPEPFLHGAEGKRYPVVLECVGAVESACERVGARLTAAGVRVARQAPGTGTGVETLRVLVGTWAQLRGDPALAQLDRGPAASGVYARFDDGGRSLVLLDATGAAAHRLGAGAGLVAATRFEDQAPTWAITGTDVAGVAAA
ncbi:MAG: hypothetical protein WBC33_06725, partial [Conexibacter sp.]